MTNHLKLDKIFKQVKNLELGAASQLCLCALAANVAVREGGLERGLVGDINADCAA